MTIQLSDHQDLIRDAASIHAIGLRLGRDNAYHGARLLEAEAIVLEVVREALEEAELTEAGREVA